MANNQLLSQWTTTLRKNWVKLASTASFIVAIVGAFIKPFGTSGEESRMLLRFAPVTVTFVVGVVFLFARRLTSSKFENLWFAAAVINLALLVTAFFVYTSYIYTRTCEFDNNRVIIGTRYTPHTLKYLETNQGISCTKLLDNFAGQADDIWTAESINESRRFRDLSYFSVITVFALAFLTLGQALSIAATKRRSRVTRSRPTSQK